MPAVKTKLNEGRYPEQKCTFLLMCLSSSLMETKFTVLCIDTVAPLITFPSKCFERNAAS